MGWTALVIDDDPGIRQSLRLCLEVSGARVLGVATVAVSRQNVGSQDGAVLHFAVTDAGPGIPMQFRERVFEKFFRVERHRRVDTKERKGTGIGLYLCKHIITAHGGHIWCDVGDHGIGTRIAVTLPGEG
jgi:two-component system, NtrC family, sensor histidine kinase KinB